MPLTNVVNTPEGIVRRYSGARTGTRTAADFSITIGVSPKYVRVVNLTTRTMVETFGGGTSALTGQPLGVASGLPLASNFVAVAAGTMTYADGGLRITDSGFSVTVATASLETNDCDLVWEAWY